MKHIDVTRSSAYRRDYELSIPTWLWTQHTGVSMNWAYWCTYELNIPMGLWTERTDCPLNLHAYELNITNVPMNKAYRCVYEFRLPMCVWTEHCCNAICNNNATEHIDVPMNLGYLYVVTTITLTYSHTNRNWSLEPPPTKFWRQLVSSPCGWTTSSMWQELSVRRVVVDFGCNLLT